MYKYSYGNSVGDFYPYLYTYIGDPPGSTGHGKIDYREVFPGDYHPYRIPTTDIKVKLNPQTDQYKSGYRDGFKDGYNAAFGAEANAACRGCED